MTAIGITAIIVAGIVALAWRALDFAENEQPSEPEDANRYEFELRRAERLLELSAKEEDNCNFDTARAYRSAAEKCFSRAEKLR